MPRFQNEPPADHSLDGPHFVVGQDAAGRWLAIETHNLGGGPFKSRADALHFADVETDHRPGAVEVASEPLQLRF